MIRAEARKGIAGAVALAIGMSGCASILGYENITGASDASADGSTAGDADIGGSSGSGGGSEGSSSGSSDALGSSGGTGSDGSETNDATSVDGSILDAPSGDATAAGCRSWALGGVGVPAGTVATASTTATAQVADYAIDGNLATDWNSGTHAVSWLTLNFPTPQTITGIRVAGGLVSGCSNTYTFTRAGTSTVIGHAVETGSGAYTIEPAIALTPGAYSGITISVDDGGCAWVQVNEVSLLTSACP